MRWNARRYHFVELALEPRHAQYGLSVLFISPSGRSRTGLPASEIAVASPIRCASPWPSAIALVLIVPPPRSVLSAMCGRAPRVSRK